MNSKQFETNKTLCSKFKTMQPYKTSTAVSILKEAIHKTICRLVTLKRSSKKKSN